MLMVIFIMQYYIYHILLCSYELTNMLQGISEWSKTGGTAKAVSVALSRHSGTEWIRAVMEIWNFGVRNIQWLPVG